MIAWFYLAGAIIAECAGTLGLRGVAKAPSTWSIALIVVAYVVSFGCMAVALRTLNVAVVYAVWSAVGMAAIAVAGAALFDERLSLQALAGLGVIVLGVALLVTSGSIRHS